MNVYYVCFGIGGIAARCHKKRRSKWMRRDEQPGIHKMDGDGFGGVEGEEGKRRGTETEMEVKERSSMNKKNFIAF